MPAVSNPNLDLIELCQSDFERAIFMALTERGYRVTPQVGSQGFSIDMVVEGENGLRLAIECDGDRCHGPERWADDMRRQRILERVGWSFWRCFASTFYIDPEGTLEDLICMLDRMKIRPIGGEASSRLYTEHRVISATEGVGEDKSLESERSRAKAQRQMKLFDEATAPEQQFDGVLSPGDRVVIRYLHDERSRPEFYILTDKANDAKNGLLSLSSPLARALAEAAPDDEFTFSLEDGRKRTVLFMNLERARAV